MNYDDSLTPNELGGSLMSERVKRIKKERRKRIRMRGKPKKGKGDEMVIKYHLIWTNSRLD
ncbi:hypothetical protein Hanom_Chr06g00569451 [Helianthus anomalus]